MKISFLGAAKTVTGSCFFIETGKTRFLVDCGLFQGQSSAEALNNQEFPFDPARLDFILLTHAHIDHSGRIPKISKDGFSGPIYCTRATKELCEIMLPDSGHIQEFEAEWENRKRLRAGKPPEPPLYTMLDAEKSLSLFIPVKYFEKVQVSSDVTVRFNDAGHILGSSIIEIWIAEKGTETKIVFSGDIGNWDVPILRNPTLIDSADYLVMECTYGNRLHQDKATDVRKFMDIVVETVDRGGNVVIPSFAVGRTQEILYDLNKYIGKYDKSFQRVLEIPVYVDSPLAISATEIFMNNPDCYDEEAKEYLSIGDHPLDFPGLKFTRTADESRALNTSRESAIIISASGMCEAGRIKHHLKHNLWRPESSVIFVGYQAPGTLGRLIADGARKVRIFGEEISVNARIEKLDGFSGHADRNGLIKWLKGFTKKPRKIFVVHGEEEAMADFSAYVSELFGLKTVIPNRGETYRIEPVETEETRIRTHPPAHFKRIELVKMIDRLRDEFEELSGMLKDELKSEKSEYDEAGLDRLKDKLEKVEKAFLDTIG